MDDDFKELFFKKIEGLENKNEVLQAFNEALADYEALYLGEIEYEEGEVK